jgi:hypothetical protein
MLAMVAGGTVGSSKAGWFLARCALVLGLAAGCGSRTSMLDQEGYLASGGDGGTGSTGGSSQGGSSAGGKNDPGAVSPRAAEEPCKRYCKGYQVACNADLGGRDCVSTCVAEASSKNRECQTAAVAVLECFTPFFTPGQDCESANTRGGAACGQQLDRYNQCLDGSSTEPMMPRNCRTTASGGGDACFAVLTCPAGDFVVECSPAPGGGKRCSCSWSTGSTSFEYGPVSNPCERARLDCGLD